MDFLLADPFLLDGRPEPLLKVLDALLHHVLGRLAPAVIRTVSASSNHDSRISATPSIRWACGPSESAISASRLLFELF